MNDNYMKTILSGVKEWTENLTDDAIDKANNALDKANNALDKASNALDKALYVVNITENSDGALSADKTFEEIVQAYNEGKYNIVAKYMGVYIMPPLAIISNRAIMFGTTLNQGVPSVVSVTVAIASDNSIQMTPTPLATTNSKLPNPYPLTFTGAVSETYDGSSAKTITIPSGGSGETIIAEETVLASGTIATETEANTFTASGITFGMLRNYKHWTVEFKSENQNTYLAAGYKFGVDSRFICRLQARNIKFQCEWLDKEKTIIRVFFVGGSGYGYGISDISLSTNTSDQASMSKQDQYIIADVVDDTMLGFFNYAALTNDILWRVKGVFKYGN